MVLYGEEIYEDTALLDLYKITIQDTSGQEQTLILVSRRDIEFQPEKPSSV
jgi:hypothetical protein